MQVVASYRFSRDEACHLLGLKHPVYILMDKLKELQPGQAVEVETDDADWALAIEAVAKAAKLDVKKAAQGNWTKLVIAK